MGLDAELEEFLTAVAQQEEEWGVAWSSELIRTSMSTLLSKKGERKLIPIDEYKKHTDKEERRPGKLVWDSDQGAFVSPSYTRSYGWELYNTFLVVDDSDHTVHFNRNGKLRIVRATRA